MLQYDLKPTLQKYVQVRSLASMLPKLTLAQHSWNSLHRALPSLTPFSKDTAMSFSFPKTSQNIIGD
jgi:hypothetical protein